MPRQRTRWINGGTMLVKSSLQSKRPSSDPIFKGETWISKGVISDKGCCMFSNDPCEECCPPAAAGTSSSGSSSGSGSELETLKGDSETECSRFGDACELKSVDGKGSCCVPKCDNPSHLQETEEREPGVPQGCVQMVCLSQPDNTCLFPDVEKRNEQMAPEQFPGIVSKCAQVCQKDGCKGTLTNPIPIG